MYYLYEQNLRKGDIILLRSDSDKSKMIRHFANSQFSHAMLYLGGSSLIDSDGPGVHSHNILRVLISQKEDVLILRSKNGTQEQLLKVERFVRSKIGTEYSMEEARKVIRNEKYIPEDNRQFCTRLVAKAYEYSGLNIVEKADYCSPKDLEESTELFSVPVLLNDASKKWINIAIDSDNNPLKKQEAITNKVLVEIRTLTGEDIQNFEQIDKFLEKNLEHDSEITRIVTESGYLNLWELDIQINPWHYDFNIFINHFPENQLVSVAKQLVEICRSLFERYMNNKLHYEERRTVVGAAYFQKMFDLYSKLLDLIRIRMEVAFSAMESSGLSEKEILAIIGGNV